MRVFIASHEPAIATVLRGCLNACGIDSSLAHTLTFDDASRLLSEGSESVDALLLVSPNGRDSTIQAVERFRSLTGVWLIAVGTAEAPRDVLDVLHHGADDFIDLNRDLSEQIAAVLKSPRRRSEAVSSESSPVLAVMSASGGAGASSIAANLAVVVAKLTGNCGLFDLDLEKGDLAHLLNLSPRHTVAELCRNATGLDHNMLKQSLATHASNVSLLAASQETRDAADRSAIDEEVLSRILDLGCAMFPCCVLDLGGYPRGVLHRDVLRACHRILVVLKLDFTGVCNARRTLEALELGGIDASRIALVANRRGMPVEIPPNKAQTILGRPIDYCIPDDELTANLCTNCGTPYTLESPKTRIARSVRSLGTALLGDSAIPITPQTGEAGTRKRWMQITQQAVSLLLFMRTTSS